MSYIASIGGGGGASDAFTIIQPDTGTAPTATSATSTLNITSSDDSILVDGDATSKTIDLTIKNFITNLGNQGGSLALDFASGPFQALVLTGNVTVTSIANPVIGATYYLQVNSGGGGFAMSFPTIVQWPSDAAPTITTAANRLDLISLVYNGTVFMGNIVQNFGSQPALLNTKSLNLGSSNTTKYVNFGNNYNFSFASLFSVSGWVYVQSGANVLFSKEDGAGIGFDMSYKSSTFVFYWSGNGSARFQVTTTNTFSLTTWYHVVLTYDGTDATGLKIYVNGVNQTLTVNNNTSSGAGTSTATFDIGSYNSCAGSFFHGSVNQFAVASGTVLSSGQVAQIYNGGTPPDISQLNIANLFTSWWYLNQLDSASTITDHIGSITGTGVNLISADYTTNVP